MSVTTLRSAPITKGALFALVLAGAAVLRLWGLASAPAAADEARMLHQSALVWGSARSEASSGERIAREPSLALDLQLAAQSVTFAAGSVTGSIRDVADLRKRLETSSKGVLVAGRILSVLLGVAAVGLAGALAWRIAGEAAGWIAAILVALNPAAVSASQRAAGDAPFLALVLASLLAIDALAERPSMRRAFLAGLAIGGASALRVPGLLLLVPLVVLHLARGKKAPRADHVAVAVLATVLVFIVTSPAVVMDPAGAFHWARLEFWRLRFGALGSASRAPAALAYARALVTSALGIPAMGLAAIGIVLLARKKAGRFAAPALFAAAYALAIGIWRLSDARFLLPLTALLLLAAAYAIARAAAGPQAWRRALVPIVLVALAAAPGASALARQGRAREAGDTREKAAEWIRASLPPGSSLALERYGPALEEGRRVIYWIPFHSVLPHVYDHAYHLDWYRGFDYIVVNEAMESRYAADPRAFATELNFYLDLARRAEFIKGFTPAGGTGPAIAIYKPRSHDLRLATLDSLLAAAPRTKEMSDFLNGLGSAYLHLGNEPVAATMQRKALEITPGDPRIYGNLGATYIAGGQPDAALEVLKAGVERFPDVPELRYNLANAYRSKKINERAGMEYEEAIRLKPSFADAYLNLGQVYADEGRYPEAAGALETYLRLVPDSPRAKDIREGIAYFRSHRAPVRPGG